MQVHREETASLGKWRVHLVSQGCNFRMNGVLSQLTKGIPVALSASLPQPQLNATGQSKLNESHTQHNKATCILHVCRVSRWYAYMYVHALDTTGRSASTYECGVFTNNSLNTRQCNEGSHMTVGYTHTYMFVGVYKQDQLTPNWGV